MSLPFQQNLRSRVEPNTANLSQFHSSRDVHTRRCHRNPGFLFPFAFWKRLMLIPHQKSPSLRPPCSHGVWLRENWDHSAPMHILLALDEDPSQPNHHISQRSTSDRDFSNQCSRKSFRDHAAIPQFVSLINKPPCPVSGRAHLEGFRGLKNVE
jgi:hypothetical protein